MTHTHKDTNDLWDNYQRDHSDTSRNSLVVRYMAVVQHEANKLKAKLPRCVELDDLVSCGVIGLMESIVGFDRDRGTPFTHYCRPRIRGAMIDELRRLDWIPRAERHESKEVEQMYYLPTEQIDESVQADDSTSRAVQRSDLLRFVTKDLTRVQCRVMVLYYFEGLTMEQIGKTLGLTRTRISQIHSHVINRLQTELRDRRSEFEVEA